MTERNVEQVSRVPNFEAVDPENEIQRMVPPRLQDVTARVLRNLQTWTQQTWRVRDALEWKKVAAAKDLCWSECQVQVLSADSILSSAVFY